MALDLDSFVEKYPQFADTDAVLVESVLADALSELNSNVWGSKLDIGHGLLTAAMLTDHPGAECIRIEGDDTRFWQKYKDLRCRVTMGRQRVI